MSCRDFYRDTYRGLERNPHYSPASEPSFAGRVAKALRECGDEPKRVLDYGCGSGAATERFLEKGHLVTGVDVSESAVRVARQRVPQGTFELIEEDGRTGFSDASFDVCFCSEVLEHLLDVKAALAEIRRILQPGGLLLATVPYHGFVKNLLVLTFWFEKHFDPYSGHVRFFSETSLRRCVEEHGFRVRKTSGIGRGWPVYRSLFLAAEKIGEETEP